ncbi:MAG: cupin domain-containing protein [Microthrixaceae bacterium]
MAVARTDDGSTYATAAEINGLIAPASVERVGVPAGLGDLLTKKAFGPDDTAEFVRHADPRLVAETQASGWPPPVVQVCRPGMPAHMVEVMRSYADPHTNPVDEIHHVVDGAIEFGFVTGGGRQVLLVLEPGDALSFPAGTEHWSVLTDDRRVTTYVYLSSATPFEHHYTGTAIAIR